MTKNFATLVQSGLLQPLDILSSHQPQLTRVIKVSFGKRQTTYFLPLKFAWSCVFIKQSRPSILVTLMKV